MIGADGADGPPGAQGEPGKKGADGHDGLLGEQGKPGDQGVQGNRGMQGLDGMIGVTGVQGIPGRPGAEGRAGTEGRAGSEGRPGSTGETGTPGRDGTPGATGAPGGVGVQGVKGKSAIGSNARLAFLFAFVILGGLAFGFRIQQNTADIRDNQIKSQWAACQGGKVTLIQFNKLLTDLVQVQRENIEAAPRDKELVKARRRLIVIYSDAIVTLPDCSKLTKPGSSFADLTK